MKKIIVLLFVLTALPALTNAETSSPEALLAAARRASGGAAWDKIITWHETGSLESGGLKGTYNAWYDFPTMHGRQEFQLGATSGSQGWDGQQPWTTDNDKMVRIETSQEVVADVIKDSYRNVLGFYFPGRYPATMTAAGERKEGGTTYAAIKIEPKNGDPFEVWFDPATHLINREVELTGPQQHSYLYFDYQPYGGILAPKKTIDRVANNPKFDTVSLVNAIEFPAAQPVAGYAPPAPPKDTATWPAGKTSVTVPFQLINNHIYVQASINGQPATPFMFDTGAVNVLVAEAAKKMGIASEGSMAGGGFGDNVPAFGLAKIKSASVGGFTLPNQVFTTMSSSGWQAVEGAASDGLLGYEFAKRAVLTVDYAHKTMTFTQAKAFHPPVGVAPVRFTFAGHIPMLPATLDGIPGEFELDTGARSALTVMAAFAKTHGLVEKYHATVLATVGYGVGGPAQALLGRAGKLVIGDATVNAPIAEIVTNKHGAGSETHTAGNIGGDILKRFTVTLDYGKQLAYFQPNSTNNEPEVFDRSGLWIMRAADGDIAIGAVTSKSAADELGIKTTDEIKSINGQPASTLKIYEVRTQFKGAAGTKIELGLKSNSGAKTVTLMLANQV